MLEALPSADRAALDDFLPLVYDELRALAGRCLANERVDHTLQPTALVNEAYFRLIGQRNLRPGDRAQFFAIAATTIRRILVDHAKRRGADKRGGGGSWQRITLADVDLSNGSDESNEPEVRELDEALNELAMLDERAAKVVTMRYFGGMTLAQVAYALGVSTRTIADDWAMAKAWLRRALEGQVQP
jgi:RNA polymerase sigma factor (TIGR02999 family)